MTKDDVLGLCHFYGGENIIPEQYDKTAEGRLWRAEKFACEYPSMFEGYENREKRMAEIVCSYVNKWDYDRAATLDVYFQKTPTYRSDYYQLYGLS